ncbi:MAG: protein translocase subunit SecD [Candidatus Ancillula sp.]|jgi:preprotein translocase subunit SecD|nr:protein translocase subunit SecD [Candidatus Ancillula sp.]
MAVNNSAKKVRPVRTLVTLFIAVLAIYGSVGVGVLHLHWGEVTAKAGEVWNSITHKKVDEKPAESPSASTDPSASASASPSSAETASPSPSTSSSSESPSPSASASPSESPSPSSSPSPEAKKEEPKKSDSVSFLPKFALDLAGGTQIILTPQLEGGATVDDKALDQAIEVIRQRIDASGVAESEINKQGSSNIVVGIPGETPSDDTINLISKAARMRFRPVLLIGGATEKFYSAALGQKSALATPDTTKLDKNGDGKYSEDEIKAFQEEANEKDKTTYESQLASDTASGTSKFSQITEEDIKKFDELDCSKEENRKGGSDDPTDKLLITCSHDGSGKYVLSQTAVEGSGISQASSGLGTNSSGKSTGEYKVFLKFHDAEDGKFIDITNQIKVLDSPRNQFAIVLDGLVISAPSVEKTTTFTPGNGVEISGGSGGNSREWANTLANQLSFGALPMSFKVDSTERVSATLGSEQLEKGLLAGVFGLLLVILYSLYQYRALGLITVGSLGVASIITYGVILLLSWTIGYRLSLPGVIGLIVSIGITADSFIVYFERIRDELRDGRSLDLAVSRGWKRALRTILASDTVNILAAVILYVLAVGGVRGFAFTLGLTTFIDLFVVCMFTHPIVILLSKMRFFRDGHPASGLSAYSLGAKDAEKFRKLTKEEKIEINNERKEQKKSAKLVKVQDKNSIQSAKKRKEDEKKKSKLHRKEFELEMRKRSALLRSGADAEDVANTKLTIAERAALAEGKDLKKLAKAFQVAPDVDVDKTQDEDQVDVVSKPKKRGRSNKAVVADAKSGISTVDKKQNNKNATDTPKKRGKSAKGADIASTAKTVVEDAPKKRGRPSKPVVVSKTNSASKVQTSEVSAKQEPKRRGRPPKAVAVNEAVVKPAATSAKASTSTAEKKQTSKSKVDVSKKSGRPVKKKDGASTKAVAADAPKRGRPPKAAVAVKQEPKRRGRPPKASSTPANGVETNGVVGANIAVDKEVSND